MQGIVDEDQSMAAATAPVHRDELHFTRLWMQAQPAVASTLAALIRDPHAVDDLIQEVAVAAFHGFAGFDVTRNFTGWAIGIARHKATDWYRARDTAIPFDMAVMDQLAATCERLAPELSARELALHACLSQLGQRAKEVLRLRYAEDHDLQLLAQSIGISTTHAKVILHRAREALRACIERRLPAGTSR